VARPGEGDGPEHARDDAYAAVASGVGRPIGRDADIPTSTRRWRSGAESRQERADRAGRSVAALLRSHLRDPIHVAMPAVVTSPLPRPPAALVGVAAHREGLLRGTGESQLVVGLGSEPAAQHEFVARGPSVGRARRRLAAGLGDLPSHMRDHSSGARCRTHRRRQTCERTHRARRRPIDCPVPAPAVDVSFF
jgi:hypothetical protein